MVKALKNKNHIITPEMYCVPNKFCFTAGSSDFEAQTSIIQYIKFEKITCFRGLPFQRQANFDDDADAS